MQATVTEGGNGCIVQDGCMAWGQIEQWENKNDHNWYRAIRNGPERCTNQQNYHLNHTCRHIV
jgi:hypothetical protein